jgi:hypothetical protein
MSKSGIVYKLCCVDTDITEEYIGSTKNFTRRRTAHKTCCNNEKSHQYNYYVYQFIRSNGGWQNWRMIQLEVVNYNTKQDLEAHERRWIEQLKPKLNKAIPGRTYKEYYEENKIKISERNKEFRKQNKEYVSKQDRIKYEKNKDKILEQRKKYYNKNKDNVIERVKIYEKKNKDKLKEYRKKYNEENRHKIMEYKKQKVKCVYCDIDLRNCSLTRHNKTGRHIYNYIYY